MTPMHADAAILAQAVRDQKVRTTDVIKSTLEQIATLNPALNCFTTVLTEAAIAHWLCFSELWRHVVSLDYDPGQYRITA